MEKLSMKSDIVFKAFFSRNKKFLKSFLDAILGENVKIKKVMHDVRLEQLTKEMKYGVLDLDVELESGELINVEMQLRNNYNIEERTTFYASKKIVEQLEPKGKYEDLKKVIVIAILNYSFIKLPKYVTETVRVAKTDKEYEINNTIKYYYIELEKFRNQNPNMEEKINQWLAFIDMERGDLLEMAKEKNKEIKEATDAYQVLTGDDEIKRIAEIRLMSELEEQSALATARAKGTEEGLKQGKEEGLKQGKEEGIEHGKKQKQKEIAKRMLSKGINIEEIIELTELSKEEIEKLK